MELIPFEVTPDKLLLDPNNYRFHDLDAYRPVVSRQRFGDTRVQTRVMDLLLSADGFELQALKDSIMTNGYVPLERIVVEEYDTCEEEKRYLVVEGNRRVAAIKSLLEEHEHAVVSISEEKLATIRNLPATELVASADERTLFKQTIMAIRHVAGIREWGPYQQAKLIAELYEQEEQRFGRVAQRVGIQAREVGRRFRAINALEQMENDEEYGQHAVPKLYAFFHEAVSIPRIREWLGWSDTSFSAENEEARRNFYELLLPRTLDGELRPPKITEIRDLRKLKNIVGRPLPLSILLDPEKSFEEAVDAAEAEVVEDVLGQLEHALAQAIRSLNQPSIDAWLNPTEHARELWNRLVSTIDKIRPLMEQ